MKRKQYGIIITYNKIKFVLDNKFDWLYELMPNTFIKQYEESNTHVR